MRPPPEGERTVALAFLEGEGCVDFVKAPLRQLGRLDHRDRDTGAIAHDPLLAGMRLWALARRPAGRPLLARQHQLDELLCQPRTIAERELLERLPIHIAIFLRSRLSAARGHTLIA